MEFNLTRLCINCDHSLCVSLGKFPPSYMYYYKIATEFDPVDSRKLGVCCFNERMSKEESACGPLGKHFKRRTHGCTLKGDY